MDEFTNCLTSIKQSILSTKKKWASDTQNMDEIQNKYAKWNKLYIYSVWLHLYKTSRKWKLCHSDRRISGERKAGGRNYKRSKETSGGGEYINCLDCGDGFTSIHIIKNVSSCTLHAKGWTWGLSCHLHLKNLLNFLSKFSLELYSVNICSIPLLWFKYWEPHVLEKWLLTGAMYWIVLNPSL